MDRTDIITVEITPEMYKEAREDKEMLSKKIGLGTRPAIENRDLIGSIAHQVVEDRLIEMGIPFHSSRKEIFVGGDKGDIELERSIWARQR